tara:strand:- start:1519 stop:2220 length:702 start_codon:yes stop_codon:yes gene_type:complete
MEWPSETYAKSLFPSLPSTSDGLKPVLPNDKPVWEIFAGGSDASLKHQIKSIDSSLLTLTDRNTLSPSITFDESNGAVLIEEGAEIGPSTHFVGPCFVGKAAIIRHGAYIRENAWICSTAIVGHCSEVKHSVLLPGAKAPHFNYVGDSILGRGVNLGAGVKLSNLRNDGTEVILRVGESRVPSGLRKFGAILGENCQLGCNAVTNPGTVLGPDSIVWPNVTVTGVHAKSSMHR